MVRSLLARFLPVVLVAVAASGAATAWRLDARLAPELAAAQVDGGGQRVRTPALSVRRVPEWLAQPQADRELADFLTGVVAFSPPASCLVVRDGPREIFRHGGDVGLVPASTLKLLTAYGAMEILGPEATMRTSVVAANPPADGVVDGDLIVVGGGDPVLATAEYLARFEDPRPATDLSSLADELVAAGVREVRGALLADDGRYDRLRAVPTWDPVFVSGNAAGPLGALVVNSGFVAFPTNTTSNVGSRRAADPAEHAAGVLRALLAERGVTVVGGVGRGTAPSGAIEVAAVDSPPVRELLDAVLAWSDNTVAELLVKEVGYRARSSGTTSDGLAVILETLEAAGLSTAGQTVADGSGLDRASRLSCDFLIELLSVTGLDSEIGSGLAVAGRTGTLRNRLEGTDAEGRVVAKTGSVRNARTLAGFALDQRGSALTFAFLANDDQIDGAAVLGLHDLAVQAMVAHPAGPARDALGPLPPRSG